MSDPNSFIEVCRSTRVGIKTIAAEVRTMHGHPGLEDYPPDASPEEAHENLILAYRHLEDAAMRIGKAIQAYDGGKSIYDK